MQTVKVSEFKAKCLASAMLHARHRITLTPDEIVRSYPSLDRAAVQASLAYAAELDRERVVPLSS
ncbi:MAG: DUF433 domain-containing protein [Gammaproteobacteria bacterium]